MVKVLVNKNNWKEVIPIFVMHYRDMEMMDPGTPLLQNVRKQYANMANGGDGGPHDYYPKDFQTMKPSVRESTYPDAPDEFFQELCDLLGWHR